MADYRVGVYDSSTGLSLAEVPARDLSFNRVLSGCGQCSFTVPLDHPKTTEDNFGQKRESSDREITVFRDDVPVWNGPVTGTEASMSSGALSVTAREASWHLSKRVLEEDKDYDGSDVFDAVRDLVDYAQTKVSNGDDGTLPVGSDIIAALPRFSVSPSSTAGATFSFPSPPTFDGDGRHLISECFDFLAADPETGFEWRMDYSTGSTRQAVHRTLTLGYPQLGSTLTYQLTEAVLLDWGRREDWERSATRVHVMYQGGVETLQSALSVTNGILLSEIVDDYSDTTRQELAHARARDLRRLRRPAARVLWAVYQPGQALPYDFCDLGDTVPLEVTWPNILSVTSNVRRVVDKETAVGDDGQERVTLTLNDPLTDLGA